MIALVFGALPALAGPGGGGHGGGHGGHGGGSGGSSSGDGSCDTYTRYAGNTISTCPAGADSYVPDVEAASPSDAQRAKEIQQATLDWCGEHQSTASLSQDGFRQGRPGATHWVKPPQEQPREFKPGKPIMGMWVDGKLVGAVYSDSTGFPSLGSVPRPHSHHGSGGKEMMHVWCSEDLAEAFASRGPHMQGGGGAPGDSGGTGSTSGSIDSGSADSDGSTSTSDGGGSGHSGHRQGDVKADVHAKAKAAVVSGDGGHSGDSGDAHGGAKAGTDSGGGGSGDTTRDRREALSAFVDLLDQVVDLVKRQVATFGG